VKIAPPPVSSVPPLVLEQHPLVERHAVKGIAYALGQRVLVVDGATLTVLDRPDAAPVATRTLESALSFGTQPGDTPVRGNVIVGQRRDGTLVALDAATLRDAWSFPRSGKREYVIGIAHAKGTIATQWSLTGGADYEIVALDDATGAVRWTRQGHMMNVWGGGSNIFLDDHAFTAVDAMTGKDVFQREHYGVHHVAADGARVVTTYGDDTVRVLDARSGAELSSAHVGVMQWGSEIAIDGGTAYVYASEIRDEELKAVPSVVAIDLATGTTRWRHETPNLLTTVHDGMSTGGVATTPSSVLFCTSDGVLHALDRARGNEQWSYGVGHCNPIVVAEHGAAAYVQSDSGSDLLTPGERRPRKATITGVVKLADDPVAGATVTAFGRATTADANGHYTLPIEAQGLVVVSARGTVPGDDKCDPSASGTSRVVSLDDRATYEVDVPVTQQCWCGL
jgi:outer membrane protein assembly factor BamB